MAKAKEGLLYKRQDDTRQDIPIKPSAEVNSADPGEQDGQDTRRDHSAKAQQHYVCGAWGVIQDKMDGRRGVM